MGAVIALSVVDNTRPFNLQLSKLSMNLIAQDKITSRKNSKTGESKTLSENCCGEGLDCIGTKPERQTEFLKG